MKEVPLSTCERTSIVMGVVAGVRHDNRPFMEVREITLNFGKDHGSCTVTLGETRVLATVTCEVVEPRPSRPNEGKLSIAVHLSPMAAPHFEPGRGTELVDELQMVLDRNIKDSRCLDLESLCIQAEESVWQLRVDVTVLNHGGNLGDACNLASVAALRHFHRPDVTVEEDGRVTVHSPEERPLLPTFMKKIPVCLTYAFFLHKGRLYTLMDPTHREERVMSGKLVVGLNPHGEITSLVFPGWVELEKKHIMKCISSAFSKAKSSAEMVHRAVEEDLAQRKTLVKTPGFTNCLRSDSSYTKQRIKQLVKQVDSPVGAKEEPDIGMDKVEEGMHEVQIQGAMEEESDEEASIPVDPSDRKQNGKVKMEVENESDGDEEEEVKGKLTAQDLG